MKNILLLTMLVLSACATGRSDEFYRAQELEIANHLDSMDKEIHELQDNRQKVLDSLWTYVCCHHDQMPKDLQFDCAVGMCEK